MGSYDCLNDKERREFRETQYDVSGNIPISEIRKRVLGRLPLKHPFRRLGFDNSDLFRAWLDRNIEEDLKG